MTNIGKWRPHTTALLITGMALILVALVVSYMVQNFQPRTQVKIGSGVYSVQIADTELSREQGLSGVETLASNGGMLFVFDESSIAGSGIWMKDMKIPLDIVWLGDDKKVVHIVTNASPDLGTSKTFTPTQPAKYVLELPAGTVKNASVKIGTEAEFNVKGDSKQ